MAKGSIKSVELTGLLNWEVAPRIVAAVLDPSGEPAAHTILFDFSGVTSVQPDGLVTLCTVVGRLRARGGYVEFRADDSSSRAMRYLRDAGFFALYGAEDRFPTGDLRKTTFPIALAGHTQRFDLLDNGLLPWLASRANAGAEPLADLKGQLLEIFNNIHDHSGEKTGCFFAQHYPHWGGADSPQGLGAIHVGASDFGIGIPASVRGVRPDLPSDIDCLVLACQDGFSARTTPRNRGAGLAHLVRNVVDRYIGEMVLVSGRAWLRFRHADVGHRVRTGALEAPFPGTLIRLVIPTQALAASGDDGDMEW